MNALTKYLFRSSGALQLKRLVIYLLAFYMRVKTFAALGFPRITWAKCIFFFLDGQIILYSSTPIIIVVWVGVLSYTFSLFVKEILSSTSLRDGELPNCKSVCMPVHGWVTPLLCIFHIPNCSARHEAQSQSYLNFVDGVPLNAH